MNLILDKHLHSKNGVTRFVSLCVLLLTLGTSIPVDAQIYNGPILRCRGSLDNSYNTFTKTKKGRVAFLGGSITYMHGWREMVMKNLTKRYPDTQFDFVNAGIPSIGSVPDAFRLDHDVLSKGDIDLLFVEAAVNDNGNEKTGASRLKGMEGVIRHTLMANPNTDIILLDFVFQPFVDMLTKGQEPDVILTHERVANHYLVPSIRLDLDIFRRLQKGEFTWAQFGGTHPKPFGHSYYAAAIERLFDSMLINPKASKPHEIPEEPLNRASYYKGQFLDIHTIKLAKGWEIDEMWDAPEVIQQKSDKANSIDPANDYVRVTTRKGFSKVPMLVATKPNKKLKFTFEGNAIGIFCVAGPSAGIIAYRIDHQPWREYDTFTQWSNRLYIPRLYVLGDRLESGNHTLEMYMKEAHNPKSKGSTLQIRQFVVNK